MLNLISNTTLNRRNTKHKIKKSQIILYSNIE